MDWRGTVDALGDLLLGARCAGCGEVALGLCARCGRELGGLAPAAVARELEGFPVTMAAGEYAGPLRQVVLATKERGALGHLPLLAELIARGVVTLTHGGSRDAVLLVPVPSVRARVVERGLDLTGSLAARAATRLRRQGVRARVVRAAGLRRDPADQAGLGRAARVRNARGAYRWRAGSLPGEVVLVDDVVTTGATLSAVAAAAGLAGQGILGAVTVAHTARRGNPSRNPRVVT